MPLSGSCSEGLFSFTLFLLGALVPVLFLHIHVHVVRDLFGCGNSRNYRLGAGHDVAGRKNSFHRGLALFIDLQCTALIHLQLMVPVHEPVPGDLGDRDDDAVRLDKLIRGMVVHKLTCLRVLYPVAEDRAFVDYADDILPELEMHAVEHRTVLFYANTLGISSKYLSFVCTCYSRKNASAWIDEAVIQKAKAMILVHHYSLSETSDALHFPTVSSFSRFFKRVTNETPKMYLQKEQK